MNTVLETSKGARHSRKIYFNKINIANRGFFRVFKTLAMFLVLMACKSDDDVSGGGGGQEGGVSLEVIAEGLVSPLGVLEAPDGSGRLFIFDQSGVIYLVSPSGELQQEPYLDLSGTLIGLSQGYDERGLLGMAFHPDFESNSRFYVHYNLNPRPGGPDSGSSWDNTSRISEFRQSATNPDQADPASERIILEADQPQGNHQGGGITFGPDGYLYIGLGDGGAANDMGAGHVDDWYEQNSGGNGQDITSNLLGSILRIDVNSGDPYAIPPDNPLVGEEGLDEIYAYGFRNPYKFSFDKGGSNQLYVGDVGQILWEEINLVEPGGNYGWNVKEGVHCFDSSDNANELDDCPGTDVYGNALIDPVIEMPNSNNPSGGETISVIGGYVYRGDALSNLSGTYVFASFSKDFNPGGALYTTQPSGDGMWNYTILDLDLGEDTFNYYIKGLGQDLSGELYIAASTALGPSGQTGVVFKLVPVD